MHRFLRATMVISFFAAVAIIITSIAAAAKAASEKDDCLPRALDPMGTFKTYRETRRLLGPIYAEQTSRACHDFPKAACAKAAPVDRTGDVVPMLETSLDKKTYQAQTKVLEEILKDWKSQGQHGDKKAFIIKEYYRRNDFDKKLDKWDAVLREVKKDVNNYMRSVTKDEKILSTVRSRMEKVKISRSYTREPGMLFETTAEAGYQMLIGGNLLRTMTSEHGIYTTLSHEIGHLLADLGNSTHKNIKSCIASKFGTMKAAGRKINQEEIWADWFGNQVYSRRLQRVEDEHEKFEAIKSAARFWCGYGGSKYGHPNGEFRMKFFAANPDTRRVICGGVSESPKSKGDYCP